MVEKTAVSLWIFLAVFLVACTSEPETPTVTFDGDGCSYSGPTELQTGVHSIVFKDLSDQNQEPYRDLFLETGRILDGHTYQDIVDLQSEPGEYFYFPKPDWVVLLGAMSGSLWEESAGARIYTLRFDEAGEYLVWVNRFPRPLGSWIGWICGSFQAVEAPDE